jgi:hypothetical protein
MVIPARPASAMRRVQKREGGRNKASGDKLQFFFFTSLPYTEVCELYSWPLSTKAIENLVESSNGNKDCITTGPCYRESFYLLPTVQMQLLPTSALLQPTGKNEKQACTQSQNMFFTLRY